MKFLQWLHRWTSLIILVQLLLWTISGLYFALVDHHGMKGHQYHQHAELEPLSVEAFAHIDARWWQDFSAITSLRGRKIEGIPQLVIEHAEGTSYLDGRTGAPWQTHQNLAVAIANSTYSGPGVPLQVTPVTATRDLHGWQGNGFRIDYNDDLNTRVYVDRDSGTVLDHRNTPWVVADWMFRLHFMDYTGGRSFNHLVIVSAGILTLWFALSGFILLAKLLSTGEMRINFRKASLQVHRAGQQHTLVGRQQQTILQVLQQHHMPIESGCGGGGTCALCKVKASASAPITAAERDLLSASELQEGYRLACQHGLDKLSTVEIKALDVQRYDLKLVGTRWLTPMLKELRFVSGQKPVAYQAGQYMQFLIPAASTKRRAEDIPEAFQAAWKYMPMGEMQHSAVRRSYSMASCEACVDGQHELIFTVRYQPPATGDCEPGIGATYLCSMQVGQSVEAEGPYGEFLRQVESPRELFLIGGGAGMAPLRAILQEELQEAAPRHVVYFYGARNRQELVYHEELLSLQRNGQVHYVPVLSEARTQCQWNGAQGFVHEAALAYLAEHDWQRFDFYLCGPPRMLEATRTMLAQLGVPQERIRFDDFGI